MIVTLKELLAQAKTENMAIGAFNVGNMELVMGAIKAAEEEQSPIIIQIAEGRLAYSPFHLLAPMMVEAAKNSNQRIAVNLDHAKSIDLIQKALDYGFSSIMYDGSELTLKENIEKSNKIVEMCRAKGVSVEAELGVVGGNEGDGSKNIQYTSLSDAVEFCNSCKIDALAVAIGNAHGHYKGIPKLNFEVLETISKSVSVPLVLHGGTGLSDVDFQKSIGFGIRKINIATNNFDAVVRGTKNYFESTENPNYFGMSASVVTEVKNSISRLIRVFNSKK